MDNLQLREEEVFKTLKALKKHSFVVIGGYAVNSYALPRFSVDCDIVIEDKAKLKEFEKIFLELGYKKIDATKNKYHESFARYEKSLQHQFKVSFDVLIGKVFDRQTKVSIPASWIFENSEIMALKGKTITEELKLRVIKADALFVMKMISCRSTDIRDLFMLSLSIKDKVWIKREVSSRYDFSNRFNKIKAKVTSKQFRDSLQGVYGLIDAKVFDRSMSAILALDELE